MSSSFLFNQSPDWAKIISDSYASVNASEEANEQLEKENDRTRIENAGVPLKMLESVAQFSSQAKKLADAIDQKRTETAERQSDRGFELKDINKIYDPVESLIKQEEKKTNELIAKQKELGNYEAITEIEAASAGKSRREQINYAKNQVSGNIENLFHENKGKYKTKDGLKWDDPAITAAGRNEIFTKVMVNHIYGPAMQAGLKNKWVRKYVDKEVFAFKDKQVLLHKAAQKKHHDAEDLRKKRLGILAVHNTDGLLEATNEWIDINSPSFGEGNTGKRLAMEHFFRTSVELAKLGHDNVSVAKLKSVWEELKIVHAGSGEGYASKHFPLLDKEISTGILDAQKAINTRESEEQTAYQTGFNNDITKIEKERGYLMSGPELAKYIRENYDITQGGPISDDIKNRLTFEENEDDLTEPLLENLWDKGLLTERDVRKLNSAELRKTWTPRIGTVSPKGVDKDQLKDAVKQAEGFANAQAKSQGKPAGRNNTQWTNIVDNAKYMFPSLYADEMKSVGGTGDEASKRIAYVNAVKRMEALIKGGSWDELVVPESDNHQRKRNLVFGERQLELDPNAFQKDIIYGSESILEQAEAMHEKGQAHLYYKQMAQKIEIDGIPIHPMALQEIQLNIARKKKGLGELPKSEMLKAYEALPPSVRTTLAQKVTPAKLIQAKIDAFGSDADITYNEIEFLLEGILDEEFNRKEYKMTEEVAKEEITPTYSDRRSKMRTTRKGDGVAAEKAKEFIGGAVQFPADYIKDVVATEAAVFSQIGVGLDERRKEVELQNKYKKRKRN